MERNADLQRLAAHFVGDFTITITNQWWVEDPDAVVTGTAHGSWIDDSFVRFKAWLEGKPTWDFVFGRSDANDRFVALYYDERAVLRVFDVTLDDDGWLMRRTDPDMHQTLEAKFDGNRMVGATHASDDAGVTWRKDFDLVFE